MLFITTAINQYCIAQKLDSIIPKSVKVSARAVPNPIGNKLNIEAKNFEAGIVNVVVVDAAGVVMYNDRRLVTSANDNIAVFLQLKTGNYYCTVKQANKMAKFGFIVAR